MGTTRETTIKAEGFTGADWYKGLVEKHSRKRPPNSLLAKEFAEDAGIPPERARSILKELMEEGVLEGKKMPIDGYTRWVFWRKDGKPIRLGREESSNDND